MSASPTLLFLNMGPFELILVLFVILMLFGAESIPKIARGLGRGMRQVKDAANEIKQDIRESADQTGEGFENPVKEITNTINKELSDD